MTAPRAFAARTDGARVLVARPTRAPVLPSVRPAPVLRPMAQRACPGQLPLFPTPGELMAAKR